MTNTITIDRSLKKPIYQQIIDGVFEGISKGVFATDDQLPSINQIANDNKLAKETVVKAFKLLQQQGIVKAIHGKGFFIASNNIKAKHHIFLLFDTLSAYKEVLFEAIQKEFGSDAVIDIYFHHFNPKTFKNLVNEAAGNYTAYIVLPFDHQKITEMLEPIPDDKLFLIDRWPRFYKKQYVGVYQDFYNDVINALSPFVNEIERYKKLVLLFRDSVTEVPAELLEGFEAFCYDNTISCEVHTTSAKNFPIEKNVAYISIDDNDLVHLVEYANTKKWKPGRDIGIISYNDTPLKKVVSGGITVVSTNFEKMGASVAQMVLSNNKACVANLGSLINRKSF